jgi:hypothetical protein
LRCSQSEIFFKSLNRAVKGKKGSYLFDFNPAATIIFLIIIKYVVMMESSRFISNLREPVVGANRWFEKPNSFLSL